MIHAGAPSSPVILHVPHSSTTIPADVRRGILLDDAALDLQLLRMTDAHTDRIAATAAADADTTPWRFVNDLSRLVIDPERFPDAREEMLAVGMGAVYTQTSGGTTLRAPDALAEAGLIAPSSCCAARRRHRKLSTPVTVTPCARM